MNLKIFHTADIHLGLQFSKYPDDLSKKLREGRFETLVRMVQTANAERCQLFVVGGDMFDTTQVAKKLVVQAAKILSEFEGVVVVLPGNHDFITGTDPSTHNDLWSAFQEAHSDRVLLLTEKKPYSLKSFDLDVCLYPAPCQNKHSKTHAVSWLESTEKAEDTTYHVGLAHGSFEGVSADIEGEYYPMKKDDLLVHKMDIWLMGHIHIQYPQKPGASDKIFYPSTPEPDGFDCRHEGRAWILEVDPEKRVTARSTSTGHYRFLQDSVRIESQADLDLLKLRYKGDSFKNTLVKLTLEGSLAKAEYATLNSLLQALKDDLLFLKYDDSGVRVKLTPSDIDSEFTPESFPHLLLTSLSGKTQSTESLDSPELHEDRDALQLAYELIQELKQGAAK
ncbi:MAG: metallophosphoesterase [Methylotenera sp.]|nr:metallophosphoesterase [Oligoflexia bacterium]